MATIELPGRSASGRTTPAAQVLTRAAMAAGAAPSVFNTQPWRWRIVGDSVELRADRARQLATVDPGGLMLTVSCGAALHHLRTALAGTGWKYEVARFPDPAQPDLLARVRLGERVTADPAAVRHQQAIALRRTDRRPFADVEVPAPAVERLRAAAESQGAHLHLLDSVATLTLAALAGRAAATQLADAGYRAELGGWLDRPTGTDGVPAGTAGAPLPRTVPVRDFAPGAAPPVEAAPADTFGRYAVVFTDTDDVVAWLRAGEALSALLLTATIDRLAVSPMSDVVEVPATRERLRDLLGRTGHPVLALRIGVPGSGPAPARAPRRPAGEIVEEDR